MFIIWSYWYTHISCPIWIIIYKSLNISFEFGVVNMLLVYCGSKYMLLFMYYSSNICWNHIHALHNLNFLIWFANFCCAFTLYWMLLRKEWSNLKHIVEVIECGCNDILMCWNIEVLICRDVNNGDDLKSVLIM